MCKSTLINLAVNTDADIGIALLGGAGVAETGCHVETYDKTHHHLDILHYFHYI